MSEPSNILPLDSGRGRQRLSEEKLLLYLDGKLPAAEQHEVEEWLADEGMESDALEGLQAMQPGETKQAVSRLNHHLYKSLHGKKKRRKPLHTDYFTIVALAVILMLAIVAYILVRRSVVKF